MQPLLAMRMSRRETGCFGRTTALFDAWWLQGARWPGRVSAFAVTTDVPIQLSEVVPAAPRSWTRPSPTRQARGAPSQARNANRRARLTSGHQAERERREAERVAAAVSRRESHRKLSFEEQARICQRWQRARRVERALEEESTDPAQLGLARCAWALRRFPCLVTH